MNWNDLKLFAAAARYGSFSQAAENLHTTHSTISRRISALEKDLNLRLFDRHTTGLTLTPGGEELFTSAVAMELEANSAERKVSGRDAQLEGVVRVSVIDAVALSLMPGFRRFLEAHPGILLEISTSYQEANLSRREADVAIRIGNSPAENLVGRRVAQYRFAIYGARNLVDRVGATAVPDAYPWVTWDDTIAWPALRQRMQQHGDKLNIVARMGGAIAMLEAIGEGIGVGYLALPRGESDKRLVRIGPIEKELSLDVWVLTHPDLRHTSRIRTFMDFIANEIKAGS